jgi:predicted site-specific integrase-resolvase
MQFFLKRDDLLSTVSEIEIKVSSEIGSQNNFGKKEVWDLLENIAGPSVERHKI